MHEGSISLEFYGKILSYVKFISVLSFYKNIGLDFGAEGRKYVCLKFSLNFYFKTPKEFWFRNFNFFLSRIHLEGSFDIKMSSFNSSKNYFRYFPFIENSSAIK